MKVLILTDSLSLPRAYQGGKVEWEDTYVSLLKRSRQDIEFIQVGIGGATIAELYRALNYYVHANPQLIILHAGIVDCAPRALTNFEKKVVSRLGLEKVVKRLSRRLRKARKLTYTSRDNFQKTIRRIKNKFLELPLVSIGIIPARPE
ncbi:hypothetical protein C900_03572 [Fulvivirga imtechensis AK7]|uniref:Uncharacterized protein n=1 Tax=Fulvivirga imtechensis AK7 TaxID=1237149 RepID=L8JNP5_9BACT|nr:SGNH/GDSL hydrolase family protein [Fulvivirga imtechensis]ELR70591.1 hypothetical protein C900_03572 [Fulvivirga imtechensis AK7]